MTLGDRVKALEKRQDILEAGDLRWQHLVDDQLSELTKAVLSNITQMKTWNDDFQEHLKAHYLDKKDQYASKRKPTDTNKLNNIYKGIGGGNGNME